MGPIWRRGFHLRWRRTNRTLPTVGLGRDGEAWQDWRGQRALRPNGDRQDFPAVMSSAGPTVRCIDSRLGDGVTGPGDLGCQR